MNSKPARTAVLDMNALKRYRIAKGWTQEQIATRLGIATTTYCFWESCGRQPHPRQIPRLAKLLGVAPLELTHIIEPEPAAAK